MTYIRISFFLDEYIHYALYYADNAHHIGNIDMVIQHRF